MKTTLTILLAIGLTACGKVPPPSDAAIAEVARTCTVSNRNVAVHYNGYRYNIRCE